MPVVLDLVYLVALLALSPWLAWRAVRTGRYRRDLAAKLAGAVRVPAGGGRPAAWFHGVSLGEVQLLGVLVPAFRARHPGWRVVVSATTDTGLAEARSRFPDLAVIPWPFDFSWAVGAALDRVRPAVLVLAESELWPNVLAAARRRGVPVVVVNGRMSPRSYRRLARFAGAARRLLFGNVTHFAMQEQEYADRLVALGVPPSKVTVTGSVKYDGAAGDRDATRTQTLRRLLGCSGTAQGTGGREQEPESTTPQLPPVPCPLTPLVWLAGSTHAPEEAIVLRVFASLRERFPHLCLVLVPRHPDRFEEVAALVAGSGLPTVRRSRVTEALTGMPAVVLLDTVGELGAAWGLADVGFTGGSLDGVRGGQSMIEPAGYGVPCVFGPHVWNFKAAARRLIEVGGAIMVDDEAGLERELAALVSDAGKREAMGTAARDLVRRQQGATRRTLDVLDAVIGAGAVSRAA